MPNISTQNDRSLGVAALLTNRISLQRILLDQRLADGWRTVDA